jgi:hypothetical protein
MVPKTPDELRAIFLREFLKAIIIYKSQKEILSNINLSEVSKNIPLQIPTPLEPIIPLIRRYKEKILGGDITKKVLKPEKLKKDEKIQEPVREDENEFIESMKIEQTQQRMPSMQGDKKQPLIQIKTPAPFVGQRMPSLMSQQPQRAPRAPMQRQTTPIMVGADFSNIGSERLKYLLFLMSDGSITSIECPGPEKQLIINKSGIVNPTGVSLKTEEIDGIIKEVSKRTRIPINQGLFKTAFDNLILTAVVSEFVGTRFLIERMPINQPPPGYPQRRYR